MRNFENEIKDSKKTSGFVPVFMKFQPKVIIHTLSSWKRMEEIDMERARYLVNTDEILEEMLDDE